MLLSGAVAGVHAVVSKGPLAAVRLVPKRLHLYLDLVLAAAFAASPLLYLPSFQLIPTLVSEAVAVVLVRMSLTTELVPRPRAKRGSAQAADDAGAAPGSDAVSTVATTAGRVVGTAVARARSSHAPLTAAHSLGRAAGYARRLGRAAAAGRSAGGSSQPVPTPRGSSEPPE
jgi:hypothetical protein